ncbi:MAG TPA: S8 family serine peptidase, partial [Roseimicrobium sp.]|nr:S8 family serine peptidase [Roseimicrobium sp.]
MMDNIVVTLDGQETPSPPDPDAPVIYDVNWDGPDCVVNAAPPVSTARSISSINFGYPKVRSSFAGLTSQPLELIGGSQTSYGQIRFDLGRNAERYVFETDLVITQTSKSLTLFLDGSNGLASITFNGSGITAFRASAMSASYTPTQVNRIRIEFTPSTSNLKFKLNGVDVYNGYTTDAFVDVNAIRLSLTDTTATGGAAIDNVRIEAHKPNTQPVSAPGIVVRPNPTLYFPTTSNGGEVPRYVTLTNTGTADLLVSSITSNNASFLPSTGAIPAIPPGSSFMASVKFKPLTSGLISGQLQITTNVTGTPVSTIGMQGTGIGVPAAFLNPAMLYAHIVAGTIGTESFTLGNSGNDTLNWRFVRTDGSGNPAPTPIVTNDPLIGQLWGLGLSTNAGMDVTRAWNITTGSPDIVVAVIDTGVSLTHPDLIANLAVNPTEISGNGVDDDGNGYVDDVKGWNFSANTNVPEDLNGHGTHVSGTIAASGNNNIGVVGVARSSRILPVQFLSAAGVGYTSDAIAAVNYARIRGARLINASWGGGGYSTLLRDQIAQFTTGNRGLFVAAAGNNGSDNDISHIYPVGYDLPGIVGVAATNSSDTLAYFSNFGRTTVDVSAPGDYILSTYRNNTYAFASGTSMAAPHATGTLALLFSHNRNLSGSDIKQLLTDYSDYPPALNGCSASDGRINAWRSLDKTMLFWLSPSSTQGSIPAGQTVSVQLSVDASRLSAGQYSASLAFQTNDPLRPLLTLPVQLQVTPNNAFNHWTQQTFGQSDLLHDASSSTWSMDGDPDNDRVPNLLEYLLATSATQPENVPPLEIHNDPINGTCVSFEMRIDTAGTNWNVEWSPSLAVGSWSSDNLVIEELSRDETAGTRSLVARFTTQATKPERAFFRLRAAPS